MTSLDSLSLTVPRGGWQGQREPWFLWEGPGEAKRRMRRPVGFQGSRGTGPSLAVWHPTLGAEGRWILAQRAGSPTEGVQVLDCLVDLHQEAQTQH